MRYLVLLFLLVSCVENRETMEIAAIKKAEQYCKCHGGYRIVQRYEGIKLLDVTCNDGKKELLTENALISENCEK